MAEPPANQNSGYAPAPVFFSACCDYSGQLGIVVLIHCFKPPVNNYNLHVVPCNYKYVYFSHKFPRPPYYYCHAQYNLFPHLPMKWKYWFGQTSFKRCKSITVRSPQNIRIYTSHGLHGKGTANPAAHANAKPLPRKLFRETDLSIRPRRERKRNLLSLAPTGYNRIRARTMEYQRPQLRKYRACESSQVCVCVCTREGGGQICMCN